MSALAYAVQRALAVNVKLPGLPSFPSVGTVASVSTTENTSFEVSGFFSQETATSAAAAAIIKILFIISVWILDLGS